MYVRTYVCMYVCMHECMHARNRDNCSVDHAIYDYSIFWSQTGTALHRVFFVFVLFGCCCFSYDAREVCITHDALESHVFMHVLSVFTVDR